MNEAPYSRRNQAYNVRSSRVGKSIIVAGLLTLVFLWALLLSSVWQALQGDFDVAIYLAVLWVGLSNNVKRN